MFSQVNQLEKVDVSLVDDTTNGAMAFDLDFDKLDHASYFFKFRYILPVGNKKSVKIKHAYSFCVANPAAMDPQSKELADFFATLVMNTFDEVNKPRKRMEYDKNNIPKLVQRTLASFKN